MSTFQSLPPGSGSLPPAVRPTRIAPPKAVSPGAPSVGPVFARSGPRATRVWRPASPWRRWLLALLCVMMLCAMRAAPLGCLAVVPRSPRAVSARPAEAGSPLPDGGAVVPSDALTDSLPLDTDHFVVISKDRRRLTVYEKVRSFPVAVGKNAGDKKRVGDCRTPETPPGRVFPVQRKLVTAAGGPFGSRFLGLATPWRGIAIHGSNEPASIGTMASHGCVRLHNPDVEWLYGELRIGDPVVITR